MGLSKIIDYLNLKSPVWSMVPMNPLNKNIDDPGIWLAQNIATSMVNSLFYFSSSSYVIKFK